MSATTRGLSPHGSSQAPMGRRLPLWSRCEAPRIASASRSCPKFGETLHSVQDGAYNLIITLYHEVGRVP